MKMLKKLALVSAVSMISAGAFAMEALDDESMAATTGQDGITIMVVPGVKTTADLTALGVSAASIAAVDSAVGNTANGRFKGLSIGTIVQHDDDGVGAGLGFAANMNSGSMVIGGGADGASAADILADSTVVFADDTLPIIIDIDMVGDTNVAAGNQSMLNVKISTPMLVIKLGAQYVSNSNAAAAGISDVGATTAGSLEVNGTSQTDSSGDTGKIKIANAMEIVLGASVINIQLGSETQTIGGVSSMILINTALAGGLTINNSSLIDAGGAITGGSIRMDSLKITDAGGANLSVIAGINVEDDINQLAALTGATYTGPAATEGGLVLTLFQFGGAGGADINITNQKLGSATAQDLGDIQILGLQLAGTSLIIRGH